MTEAKTPAIAVKPFKDYPDLVDILESRGMIIGDRDRAIRKIAQVGYYHLSGYWHSSRRFWIERNERGKVFHVQPAGAVPPRQIDPRRPPP